MSEVKIYTREELEATGHDDLGVILESLNSPRKPRGRGARVELILELQSPSEDEVLEEETLDESEHLASSEPGISGTDDEEDEDMAEGNVTLLANLSGKRQVIALRNSSGSIRVPPKRGPDSPMWCIELKAIGKARAQKLKAIGFFEFKPKKGMVEGVDYKVVRNVIL